jgi:ParB-like chromosome segregation protein Spo0J
MAAKLKPAMANRIEVWPIEKLVPYERNARTHSAAQVAQLAASITEFGFVNPILVDTGAGVIAGHGRLAAAKDLGLKEVPVVVLDHLSPEQRKAYVIADNKLALNAGWDMSLLQEEVIGLQLADFDLSLLGFDESELEGLLGDDDLEDGVDARDAVDEHDDANTQVVIGSYRFPLDRDAYFQWRDAIREEVGFEEDDIKAEIRRRLQIPE